MSLLGIDLHRTLLLGATQHRFHPSLWRLLRVVGLQDDGPMSLLVRPPDAHPRASSPGLALGRGSSQPIPGSVPLIVHS